MSNAMCFFSEQQSLLNTPWHLGIPFEHLITVAIPGASMSFALLCAFFFFRPLWFTSAKTRNKKHPNNSAPKKL